MNFQEIGLLIIVYNEKYLQVWFSINFLLTEWVIRMTFKNIYKHTENWYTLQKRKQLHSGNVGCIFHTIKKKLQSIAKKYPMQG